MTEHLTQAPGARSLIHGAVLAAVLSMAGAVQAAATITIVNADPAGVGFNDATPVAPVGGNTGTTLGQQRLNVYAAVASQWGATLTSTVPVKVYATWEALNCNATGATLGSAGAWDVIRDFPGAPFAGTWYSVALANKLSGVDQTPGDPTATDIRDVLGVDIVARFNVNLGNTGCLTGLPFYLGLDNNHGTRIDFYTVLLHELGHGLGFQALTSGLTGARPNDGLPWPAMWERFMIDNTSGKTWFEMTDGERRASALNVRQLAWNGANVTGALPGVLSLGTPRLAISGPAAGSATGIYPVGAASFGAPLSSSAVQAQVMPVVDQANGTGLACTTLSPLNALAVNGRIAMVDRGACAFALKAAVVQAAGAIAMIVVDNVQASPPDGLGGSDPTVTIPSVRISLNDGTKIKARLTKRSRTSSGVIANLGVDSSQYAGADTLGRALLYTPNPYINGSSVSHWDTIAFPNQLMEPSINGDLLHSVVPPQDMTFKLLQDLGW